MQFTRRVVTAEFAEDPQFRAMNVLTTAVWTAAFMACDVLSLTLTGAAGTWVPVTVMAVAVVISRLSGRLYLTRGEGERKSATV